MLKSHFRILIPILLAYSCSGDKLADIDTGPPVVETPMLVLPEVFRSKTAYEIVTADLTSALERIYPTHVNVQRFEYTDRFIKGYLIDAGSPIDAMIQHDKSFPESPTRVDNALLSGYLPGLVIDSGTNRAHLYWVMGQHIVYVTIEPLENSVDGAALLALQFAEQIINLNAEKATPPPFYAELHPTLRQPEFSQTFSAGDVVPVSMTFDYTLIHSPQGKVHFELKQHSPVVVREQSVDITGVNGEVTFTDTFTIASDIPDTGTVLTLKTWISPPYTSDVRFPRNRFDLETQALPDGTYEHTVVINWQFLIRN